MNVTASEMTAIIGELTVENRILRRQLAEAQNSLKITAAALAAKDQAQAARQDSQSTESEAGA